jgi:hypothetical protein
VEEKAAAMMVTVVKMAEARVAGVMVAAVMAVEVEEEVMVAGRVVARAVVRCCSLSWHSPLLPLRPLHFPDCSCLPPHRTL